MRLLSFSFLFLFHFTLAAQQTTQGMVTDTHGQPLAFVTILFNGEPGKGVLTDIEGRFSIDVAQEVQSLTLRHVGFEPRHVKIASLERSKEGLLILVLQAADYALPEATIRAGENPANILIRRAIANRHRNNPERYQSYSCTTYNKVLFAAVPRRKVFEEKYVQKDSSRKAVKEAIEKFEKIERSMDEHHAFMMESVTERSFLFPKQVQEQVKLNRVSGFSNAGLVALANLVQPFSFYGDYLTMLDKNYVNPISPGSPNLYFFNIEDTLYAQPDTIWVISFHPRKGKVFDALEGVLHLHSRGWAIQNVQAKPAQPGNLYMKIEQAYKMVASGTGTDTLKWFPAQLNFEMEFKNYPAPFVGVRTAGRSYITDTRIDVPLRPRDFNSEMPVLLHPKANSQGDTAWVRWRDLAPLSNKEIRTYEWLDSIGASKRFDRLSTLMDVLATGRIPIAKSPVSVDIMELLRFNDYEGTRLGLGLTTAQARPLLPQRRLEFGANLGYGLNDKAWKYGGYALWRLSASGRTQLRVGWRRDLIEPGTLYEIPPAALVNRSLYAKRMDQADEFSSTLSTKLGRYFSFQGSFRKQNLSPTYAYRYGPADAGATNQFQFTEASLFLRYANGESSSLFLGNDIGSIQRLPVFELAYTKGWHGLWGGEYNFERWTAALYHSFFLGRLGRTRWRVEAGWAAEDAPIPKLFTLNQTGGSWNIFVLPNTFQALPDTLFLSNRFVNFYFAQEVGPVFYKSKYSAPFLILLQNAAWGDLSKPELHHDLGFRTATNTLLESGLQLDNLLRINYLNIAYIGIGGAVFYRWGGLGAPEWKDNLTFRATLRMTL